MYLIAEYLVIIKLIVILFLPPFFSIIIDSVCVFFVLMVEVATENNTNTDQEVVISLRRPTPPPVEEYSQEELDAAYDEYERLDSLRDDTGDRLFLLEQQVQVYGMRLHRKTRTPGKSQSYGPERLALLNRYIKQLRAYKQEMIVLDDACKKSYEVVSHIQESRRVYKKNVQKFAMEQFDYSDTTVVDTEEQEEEIQGVVPINTIIVL